MTDTCFEYLDPTLKTSICQCEPAQCGIDARPSHSAVPYHVEHDRLLTVVRATAVFYGRPQLWPCIIPKPLNRSIPTFARLIMSVRIRVCQTSSQSVTRWAAHAYPKYNVFVCLYCGFSYAFFGSHTARTKRRRKVNDGSKDVFPVQEMQFWLPLITRVRKGSKP